MSISPYVLTQVNIYRFSNVLTSLSTACRTLFKIAVSVICQVGEVLLTELKTPRTKRNVPEAQRFSASPGDVFALGVFV